MGLEGAEEENMHPVHNSCSFGLFAQTPVTAWFGQMVTSCANEASCWCSTSRRLRHPLDFRKLFKPRLVVAALGETQRLGWWNSGVLTGTGEFVFQQGFPRSSPFAQTRAGFRVAQLACDEALAIQPTRGGPITCHLFRLTPQLEDAFENERNRWMNEPQEWAEFFQAAWGLSAEQRPQGLIDLADLDPAALVWARSQTSQTAKALRPSAGLLRQGQISRCRKNTEGMNKRHAVDSRLGPSKTVDILESMFSHGFGYTSSSFPKGKDEPASIDIRLSDGGQPRMLDPRQKGGFIDG